MKASVTATEMLKFATEVAVELHLDELLDIGMVDPEDAHVGAAAGAALLDGLGRGVDDLEEGDGAGGDALGLADEAALGPEAAEVEARAPALLVDEGGVLDRLEDRVEGVLDRQDEAGAQAHAAAGAGEGRAVGQEVAAGHGPEEGLGVFLAVGLVLLGGGDVGRDAAEEVFGGLVDELAFLVLQEVAGLEDLEGVFGKTAGCGHVSLQLSRNSHPRKLNPSGILRIIERRARECKEKKKGSNLIRIFRMTVRKTVANCKNYRFDPF